MRNDSNEGMVTKETLPLCVIHFGKQLHTSENEKQAGYDIWSLDELDTLDAPEVDGLGLYRSTSNTYQRRQLVSIPPSNGNRR